MILIALALVLATDPPAPDVTVREERGVYSVSARFVVPQSSRVALAVLTDYERIPSFMPGVKTSTVLERRGETVVVEQDGVSHLMMFSKTVHLVLEITEGADTLRFRDRSGHSFARYEGAWRLCAVAGGTEVAYTLTAQPSFDVPGFILKRLLKRDSAQMIEGLRREMAARAVPTTASPATPRARPRST
jgi:ribosome-associated toxin RatA of RatAB toxin-antitoxin module